MIKSRQLIFTGSVIIAFAFGVCAMRSVRAQITNETIRAITLYRQEQIADARRILEDVVKQDKRNLRAWHYLGLALEKHGDPGAARKAHEKAAKLGDKLLDSRMEQVSEYNDFSTLLKPVSTELLEAAESARHYLRLEEKPSRSKQVEWGQRADSLQISAEIAADDSQPQTIFKASEVDVKAVIMSKPLPSYTEEARRNHVRGTIVIRLILGANGKVMGIRPITTLPHGLTMNAIKTAQQIKFVPAMKDGKPVSMYVQVEYSFNIY